MSSQHILSMGLESDLTPDFVEEFHEAQESVVRRLVLGPRQLAQIAAGGVLFLMFCSVVSYKMGSLQAAQAKRPALAAATTPLVLSRIATEETAASVDAAPQSAPVPATPAQAASSPTPAVVPSTSQPSTPTPGTYLQVGVVAKPQFEARSAALRSMGLKASAIPGPDESTLRMLVGPLNSVAEREQAMNTLDEHGMQWFLKTIGAQ